MTFEDFQAKREEIADLGTHQGIPAQKGQRAFAYGAYLIEVRPDWLEGGDDFVVTHGKAFEPMRDHHFKSLSEAERYLYSIRL